VILRPRKETPPWSPTRCVGAVRHPRRSHLRSGWVRRARPREVRAARRDFHCRTCRPDGRCGWLPSARPLHRADPV